MEKHAKPPDVFTHKYEGCGRTLRRNEKAMPPRDGYVGSVIVSGLCGRHGANYQYLFVQHTSQRSGICIDPAKMLTAGCVGWPTPQVAKAMFVKYVKSRRIFGGSWEYLETLVVDRRGRIHKERKNG